MRSTLAYLAASLFSLSAFTGCGDDDDASTSLPPSTSDAGAKSNEAGAGGESTETSGGGTKSDAGSPATPGDAGSGGATAVPPLDGSFPAAMTAAIEAARAGGEVDLDGDGDLDLSVEIGPDGSKTTTILVGGRALLVVTRDDGTAHKEGDFDLDGEVDFVEDESEKDSGELSRSSERDTDFDGETDYKETFDIEATGTTVSVSSELVEGAWVGEEVTDDSGVMYAGEGCTTAYPDPTAPRSAAKEVGVVGTLTVVACQSEKSNGSCSLPGACTSTEVERVQNALAWLFSDAADSALMAVDLHDANVTQCLEKRQPVFLEALIHHLSVGRGARIACGISCDGSGPKQLGGTETNARSRVSLNMDQSDAALRDTIIHELIHSSGYKGAPDHNDEAGGDDSVYACSAWCTGVRKYKKCDGTPTDVMDPEGELDTHDCFRCSGTYQAKKDCCGPDRYVCVGGCCDSPCGKDGRCVTDPCDPRQNGGDFSKCRYEGKGSSSSAALSSTATVTWTYDHSVGDDVYLVPSGSITGTSSLPLCTAWPLTYTIIPTDGDLRLGYGTDPPEYSGGGISQWPITLTCPGGQPQGSTFSSGWFWPDRNTGIPFTPGTHLKDTRTVSDQTSTWDFTPSWKKCPKE